MGMRSDATHVPSGTSTARRGLACGVLCAALLVGTPASPATGAPTQRPADALNETGPSDRSITFVGVTRDQTDFESLGIGRSGYWFPQFDAPTPVEERPTGENARDALPSWAGPLNHFSFEDCEVLTPDECLAAFLTRSFSQDGPARSKGGDEAWNTFTIPDGEVGLSGAIVDPFTIGNSNNTINRIQLTEGVPESFHFHVVTDNTNREHDPTSRLRPRGTVGESDVDVDADVLLDQSDLVFNGIADVYTFRFDGFVAGDFIKLQLNGDPAPAEGASIGGFLFDELPADPQDLIADVIADIEGLAADGELKAGQALGLTRPLDNATRSLDRDKIGPACNQLGDFVAEANDKVADGALSPAAAADLIAQVEAIQAQLDCT